MRVSLVEQLHGGMSQCLARRDAGLAGWNPQGCQTEQRFTFGPQRLATGRKNGDLWRRFQYRLRHRSRCIDDMFANIE